MVLYILQVTSCVFSMKWMGFLRRKTPSNEVTTRVEQESSCGIMLHAVVRSHLRHLYLRLGKKTLMENPDFSDPPPPPTHTHTHTLPPPHTHTHPHPSHPPLPPTHTHTPHTPLPPPHTPPPQHTHLDLSSVMQGAPHTSVSSAALRPSERTVACDSNHTFKCLVRLQIINSSSIRWTQLKLNWPLQHGLAYWYHWKSINPQSQCGYISLENRAMTFLFS